MMSISKRETRPDTVPKAPKPQKAALRYELYISEEEILLRNTTAPDTLFHINRKDFTSQFVPASQLKNFKTAKPLPIYGVFGQIEVSGIAFLIAISKAQVVARLGESEIYKIESVKFLTLSSTQHKNFDYEECWDRLERTKNFLRVGFFFSPTYRLHADFSGQTFFSPKVLAEEFTASPFIWNYRSLKALFTPKSDDFAAASQFFFPIIQGFVGNVSGPDFKLLLISRRSAIMGGTRYNSRGADNTGNVANFVQTEQVVTFGKKFFSFQQVRGSLPFYWEQQKGLINPKAEIHQRQNVNVDLLSKHLKTFTDKKFQSVVFFNLLSRKREDEETLSKYLLTLLEQISQKGELKDRIFYEHIDFHAITKQADFSNVDKYIYNTFAKREADFSVFEFEELLDENVRKNEQKVLVRTNCLDCLDRTNAVQTKFAFYALYKALVLCKSSLLDVFANVKDEPLKLFEDSQMPFFTELRTLWADNGDAISKIYTGTGATTSSVTRKGEKSTFTSFLDHKFKTLSRFYLNTFDDEHKQAVIDTLLHKKSASIRQSSVLMSQTEATRLCQLKMGVVSMISCKNNGNILVPEKTIESIFKGGADCDILIVVSRLDKQKNVQLGSNEYIVCGSFAELFKTIFKQLHGFVLIEQTIESKFEISIFAKNSQHPDLSFFKAEKATISPLSQTLGVRASFIINHVGIELFGVKLETTTFGSAPGKSIEKLFEKYIDREYDLVFLVGYIEDDDVELDNSAKNYQLLLQEVRKGSRDNNFSSHLALFCSKSVAANEFGPLYSQLDIDIEGLSEELTINAHSFILPRIK